MRQSYYNPCICRNNFIKINAKPFFWKNIHDKVPDDVHPKKKIKERNINKKLS